MNCVEATSEVYGYIYLITNTVNGKVYVGQTTKSLKQRWKGHRDAVNDDAPLYRAIRKYGIDAFVLVELDRCSDRKSLDRSEQKWIAYYSSTRSELGYNATSGGRGHTFTTETRAKISASVKKWASSPEVRATLSAATRKSFEDPERRRKQSESLTRFFSSPEARQQVADTNQRYAAQHPESYEALNEYNRSPEGREERSRSRKEYCSKNPAALRALQEGSRRRLSSQEGREQMLLGLAQARAKRKALRGEWVSEEVVRAFTQGLSVKEYDVKRKLPTAPNPMPCSTSLSKIYGKTFGEIRDGAPKRQRRDT